MARRTPRPLLPAYEVLNDDLRDYRFYADDLVPPSAQAIQYVWEKFIPAVLSDEARRLLPDVRHIVVAAAHRPRTPRSEAYREFCRRRIGEIAALPQVDFQAEEEYFRRCIEINS
ncbi:MAG: GSCFA domain-containing protein [Alistipes onderdonkii]